jgi:hypothetical protein
MLLCPRPTVFGPCPDGGILFIGTESVVPRKWVTLVTTFTYEEIAKEFVYVSVVGFVLEIQSVNVAEEHIEFDWAHRAQIFDGCVQFCLQDCVVLLLVNCRLDAMPRKRATHKEEKDIGDRFEIITARWRDTLMVVDRGI